MKRTIITAFLTILIWEYRYTIIHVVEALSGS
jgi:hypothetical protein